MLIPNLIRIYGFSIEEYGRHKISQIGTKFFIAKYEQREFCSPSFFAYYTLSPINYLIGY